MKTLYEWGRTVGQWCLLTTLLVLLPSAMFAQPVSFSSQIVISDQADGAQAVFSVDMDDDGDLDVLAASATDSTVEWFENLDGTGVFSQPIVITQTLDRASFVYGADLDGDGDPDVISAVSQNEQKIVWFENLDGQGSFGNELVIATNTWDITAVRSSDMDGDGDEDVISAQGTEIKMYENEDGAGSFADEQVLADINYSINSLCAPDIDGDSDHDLLFASSSAVRGMVAWSENLDGAGSFGPEMVIVSSTWNFRSVCANDLDGDGDQDVLSASYQADENLIAWHENTNGQGSFGVAQQISDQITGAEILFSVDIDDDGDMDLVAASSSDSLIVWFENTDGEGTFGQYYVITDEIDHVSGIYCADLDGDGDNDILSSSWGDNTIAWYKNLLYVGVTEGAVASNLPQVYELNKIYPNPFNPSTTIEIALPHSSQLDLTVYNTLGEQVAVLSSSTQPAGLQSFTFDGTGIASGIYFVRADVPGQLNAVQKIVLMK
ncbi:T9SS type A sorting domain-containing protein [bacterium]|nr:T9SS type A sorting domain-containing protein [bacterium]